MNALFPAGASVQCGQTGLQIRTQVFQTVGSFAYQPSPGMCSCIVECVGAGGGGGGAVGTLGGPPAATPGYVLGGGGGASGNYSRQTLSASLVLGGVIVSVGAGGVGGLAIDGTTGATGGQTSFGAFCMALGGGGGWACTGSPPYALTEGQGGARAGLNTPQGIGEFQTYGNAGAQGSINYYDPGISEATAIGGIGGGSHFQSAERSVRHTPTGNSGLFGAFGAGGGGGASAFFGGPANGGPGGDGLCIVTEYCWINAGGPPGNCIPDCGPEWGPAPWFGQGPAPWRR